MLNIPRISSVLATVALESFFFGIYLIVTATALVLLLKRRTESASTRPGHRRLAVLLGISALFLVVAGVCPPIIQPTSMLTFLRMQHWVTTVYRFFFAFVYFAADGGSPMVFYSDWAQPTEVLQTGFLMAALTIMDGLIVRIPCPHRLRRAYFVLRPTGCGSSGDTINPWLYFPSAHSLGCLVRGAATLRLLRL